MIDTICTPFQVPLSCFGVEHNKDDLRCINCQHQNDCKKYMGNRLNKVKLNEVKFNFLPQTLSDVVYNEAEEINQIYLECHNLIFYNSFEPGNLLKHENAVKIILDVAKQFNCTPKLFILTVMHGHVLSNNSKFFVSMLLGQAAINRLTKYRAAVEAEYGNFDLDCFSKFANLEKCSENKLLDSEILTGLYVVGYKLRKSGQPIVSFFQTNEIKLNDIWLALEPEYSRVVLLPWQKDCFGTSEESKVRFRAVKLIYELKCNKKLAVSLFKSREQVMMKAIKFVLERYGFTTSDFMVNGEEYKSVFTFWSRLALALQHLYLFKFYHGDKQILKKFNTKIVYDS